MTSREIRVGVASGQFISNCPRLKAVCIAIACLLSRNWLWETHPATASTARSTKSIQVLRIDDLLFLPSAFLRSSHQRLRLFGQVLDLYSLAHYLFLRARLCLRQPAYGSLRAHLRLR